MYILGTKDEELQRHICTLWVFFVLPGAVPPIAQVKLVNYTLTFICQRCAEAWSGRRNV